MKSQVINVGGYDCRRSLGREIYSPVVCTLLYLTWTPEVLKKQLLYVINLEGCYLSGMLFIVHKLGYRNIVNLTSSDRYQHFKASLVESLFSIFQKNSANFHWNVDKEHNVSLRTPRSTPLQYPFIMPVYLVSEDPEFIHV